MINLPATIELALRKNEHDILYIGESGVPLENVILLFRKGATPEKIQYYESELALAEVYAVISYYLSHQAEVDEYVRRVEEAEAEWEAQVVVEALGDALRPDGSVDFEKLIARSKPMTLEELFPEMAEEDEP